MFDIILTRKKRLTHESNHCQGCGPGSKIHSCVMGGHPELHNYRNIFARKEI